jgi:hypothetical protein
MKNYLFSIASKVLVLAMVVSNLVFTSCQEDEIANARVMKLSDDPVVVPETKPDWTRERTDVLKNEYHDDYVIKLIDKNSDAAHTLTGHADLWAEQYEYTIEEKYETLDVAFSNNSRTGGEPTVQPTDTGSVAVTNYFFPLEDGNVAAVSDTCVRVNDAPYDQLVNVRLVSLNNVDKAGNGPHKAMTRAMYQKNIVYTEIVAELTYNTVGLENVAPTTIVLKDTVTRRVMAEDDIDQVTVTNKDREILDNTTERCYFTELFTMKSGEKNEVNKSYILNRLFKGIEPYDLIVDNFTYNFSQSYGITAGNETSVESVDSNWNVWGKTDRYSAAISGPKSVTTDYSLYHERCQYKDSYVTVDFEYINPEVSENGTNVSTASSDRSGYDKAILTNEIKTTYKDYIQKISEYVNLYKEAKHIISEDFDASSAKKEFTDNTMTCSVDYVTTYSDGEIVRTSFKHSFSRSLICTSNWTSIEANNTNRTNGATLNVSKASKSDGEWKWNQENGSISSNVTLAGSSKSNTWESTEANNVTVTYRGKTYNFGSDSYTLNNAASVANGVENGSYTDYKYSDKLSYKYGDSNVKNSTAPGLIKVEIEEDTFFPKEWGKLLSATETVAPDENRKTYVYTWSLHFEKGTLPVVVRRGSLAPEWKFEYFTNETDSRFNGGYYLKATKSWVNTIANDGTDWMEWLDTSNTNKGNMSYSTATAWGWDEGHQISGHPSVHTSRHTLTVTNGELKARDNYMNKAMTDSNVNKNGGWK